MGVNGRTVILAVQNNFAREWLQNYYLETIESAVHAVLGVKRIVEITVDPELTVAQTLRDSRVPTRETRESSEGVAPTAPPQSSPFERQPLGAQQVGTRTRASTSSAFVYQARIGSFHSCERSSLVVSLSNHDRPTSTSPLPELQDERKLLALCPMP